MKETAFVRELRGKRRARGFTQRTFADAVSACQIEGSRSAVAVSTVGLWEIGERRPDRLTCERVARVLDLDPAALWRLCAPDHIKGEVRAAVEEERAEERGRAAWEIERLRARPAAESALLDRVDALVIAHGVDVLGAVSCLLTTFDPYAEGGDPLVEALTAFMAISDPKGRERAVKAFRETCVAIAEARGDRIPPLRPAPRDPAGGVPSTGEPFTPEGG